MFFSNPAKDKQIEMLKDNNAELRAEVRELRRHTVTPEEIDMFYEQGRKDARNIDAELEDMTNDHGEIELHCHNCGELNRIPVIRMSTVADMAKEGKELE